MVRSVLRHAFVILTFAFAMGLLVAPLQGTPRAKLVLSGHITLTVIALFMICCALVMPRLRLGTRGLRALYLCLVPANWYGAVVLGPVAIWLGFPSVRTPSCRR